MDVTAGVGLAFPLMTFAAIAMLRQLLLGTFLAFPLSAQTTASAMSLKDVTRVALRFLATEDDIRAGIDTAGIRAAIDERLRAKGIALLPGRAGGEGTIDINIGATRSATGTNVNFFYFLAFRQPAKVARLPDPPYPPIPALTWTSPVSFGVEPADRVAAHLTAVTRDLMEVFLGDWDAGQKAGR